MQRQEEKLFTVQDCFEMTAIKVPTWRRLILKRKIAFVKIGRSVRIPASEVERMITEGFHPALKESLEPEAVEVSNG